MTAAHHSTEALRALWRESERKMYPLATNAPEKYQQVIRLARQIADDLSSIVTVDSLIEEWDLRERAVREAVDAIEVPLGDLPSDDVAGVGFALRDAEVRALEHQHDQQQRVAMARKKGSMWATLHETGSLKSGLADAYQAIEMHLDSGAAIVASVELDPATGAANYVLTVIEMDISNGAPVDIDPGIADVQEFSDLDRFSEARTSLRALIESR